MSDENIRPTPRHATEGALAPVPTRGTIFLRTFIPWQIVRFVAINLKMLRLIRRSH